MTETAVVAPIWETFEMARQPPGLRADKRPYNFQAYAVFKALQEQIFILGLSTGLGKTLCSYLVYKYYYEKFPTRLLVCTNKSAVLQFAKEYKVYFDDDVRVHALHPRMPKPPKATYPIARADMYRRWALPADHPERVDGLVMGYAAARNDERMIVEAVQAMHAAGIHFVVVWDEATVFKNIKTATHEMVQRLSYFAQRTVGLTATMTKGKLEEIYAVFRAMGRQITRTKREFMDHYCITVSPLTGEVDPNTGLPIRSKKRTIIGYKNVELFVQTIKPLSIVLRKVDVAKHLPGFTLRKVMVEHSRDQYELIRDIYAGEITVFDLVDPDGEEVGAGAEGFTEVARGVEVTRLTESGHIKRALLDPRLVTRDSRYMRTGHRSPKTEEFIRMLSEEFTNEKIVWYTQSRQYLELVRDTVRAANEIPEGYRNVLEIHGGVPQHTREEYRERFQAFPDPADPAAPQHNLILINDAGLESINLQSASILIVSTLPTTGGNMVQLAGRLSRLGSIHSNLLLVFLLTADSQDEDEYLIIHQQMQLMSQVMGDAERGLIDWVVLREAEAERMRWRDMTEDELRSVSMHRLLLHRRKRREAAYSARANADLFEAADAA